MRRRQVLASVATVSLGGVGGCLNRLGSDDEDGQVTVRNWGSDKITASVTMTPTDRLDSPCLRANVTSEPERRTVAPDALVSFDTLPSHGTYRLGFRGGGYETTWCAEYDTDNSEFAFVVDDTHVISTSR